MTTLKDILALLAILACYGIAGRLDYDDAVRHEEFMRGTHLEQNACAHAIFPKRAEATQPVNDDPAQTDLDRDGKTTCL